MSRRFCTAVVAGSTLVVVSAVTSVRPAAESQRRLRSVIIVSPTFPTPAPQARVECLHGENESAEEATRRRQALTAARAINTAQARQRSAIGRFVDNTELLRLPEVTAIASAQPSDLAPGWQLRLATTADRYVFAVKDTTDPCGFAYFSDDSGVIYTAQPLE